VISFQEISRYGLFNLNPAIVQFAEAENLLAHKNAVTIRLGQPETDSKLYESV
jgi:histidinol dehydrogenase